MSKLYVLQDEKGRYIKLSSRQANWTGALEFSARTVLHINEATVMGEDLLRPYGIDGRNFDKFVRQFKVIPVKCKIIRQVERV